MQFLTLWLTLVLAHLIGDFVLQRDAVVQGKVQQSVFAYAEHGAIHIISMIIMLLVFVGSAATQSRTIGILIIVVIVHLVFDFGKERISAKSLDQPLRWAFLIDQGLHLVVITVATVVLAQIPPWAKVYDAWNSISDQALVLIFGYTAVVFATGHLNAVLLKPYSDIYDHGGANDRQPETDEKEKIGLAKAGMIIGILERFLIMTAVLAESPAGVGLVVAAKSVFRFEAAKKGRRDAEYFLIGTFLSVVEAVIGGVAVHQLFSYFSAPG